MPFYGTAAGVHDWISDILPETEFTASTSPSLAQVERALTLCSKEVDVELDAQGYKIPVTIGDSPAAFEYIGEAVNAGGAAKVLAMLPASLYSFPDEESAGGDRRQMLDSQFYFLIRRIRTDELKALHDLDRMGFFQIGVDPMVNPRFRRGQFDYPGSRNTSDSPYDRERIY